LAASVNRQPPPREQAKRNNRECNLRVKSICNLPRDTFGLLDHLNLPTDGVAEHRCKFGSARIAVKVARLPDIAHIYFVTRGTAAEETGIGFLAVTPGSESIEKKSWCEMLSLGFRAGHG
jgi:hypothetical protein